MLRRGGPLEQQWWDMHADMEACKVKAEKAEKQQLLDETMTDNTTAILTVNTISTTSTTSTLTTSRTESRQLELEREWVAVQSVTSTADSAATSFTGNPTREKGAGGCRRVLEGAGEVLKSRRVAKVWALGMVNLDT